MFAFVCLDTTLPTLEKYHERKLLSLMDNCACAHGLRCGIVSCAYCGIDVSVEHSTRKPRARNTHTLSH